MVINPAPWTEIRAQLAQVAPHRLRWIETELEHETSRINAGIVALIEERQRGAVIPNIETESSFDPAELDAW